MIKLEFEVKISRWTPKQSPVQPGVRLRMVNCLVVFQKQFSFFSPPINGTVKLFSGIEVIARSLWFPLRILTRLLFVICFCKCRFFGSLSFAILFKLLIMRARGEMNPY